MLLGVVAGYVLAPAVTPLVVHAQSGPSGTMLGPINTLLLRDGVGGVTTVRVYEIPAGHLYVTDRGGIAICTTAGC